MILDLGGHGLDTDLLLRRIKGGVPARGPLVHPEGTPLDALRDGDKLHIVATSEQARVAGRTPTELVEYLAALGLPRDVRLKQIHLIAGETGSGGAESYAARLSAALEAEGFAVDEIKAPRGAVQWDGNGKVQIRTGEGWQPSEGRLNTYVGPRVPEKHRAS
jgi:hypothetical protein